MSREGERRFAVLTIPIDPSRGMEKKKISLSVELGWVKFREQRLFGRIFFRGMDLDGFGGVVGGSRWREANDIYI